MPRRRKPRGGSGGSGRGRSGQEGDVGGEEQQPVIVEQIEQTRQGGQGTQREARAWTLRQWAEELAQQARQRERVMDRALAELQHVVHDLAEMRADVQRELTRLTGLDDPGGPDDPEHDGHS